MESTSTASIKLVRAGLAAVFAFSVWRAATQSVTPGEAWNYVNYIAPAWKEALSHYDTNNHVLNTLLVRISTARIHLTEFSLRLPSLLFGALYLLAVYRLARRWFSGRIFLAVAGLLTLNPLVMDAMSEARGYGMALALLMWALIWTADAWERGGVITAGIGVLLGLSVAASLAFLAPAAALILVLALSGRVKLGHVPHVAILTAFMLLVLPLNHAEKPVVTEGPTTLVQSMNVMASGSLGTGGVNPVAIEILLAAAIVLAIVAASRNSSVGKLAGGVLLGSFALLVLAHARAGAAFPEGGAIYLIPIVTVMVAAVVAASKKESVQLAFLVGAALLIAHHADHLSLAYHGAGDLAGARDLAKALRADAHQHAVRIAVWAEAEPVVRYYRERYRQANWTAIERPQPDASYDYYVLKAGDAGWAAQRGMRLIYRDAGLVLAK